MKILSLSLFALILALSTSTTAQQTDKIQWHFEVFLNDTKIGFHRFEVIEQQDKQYVYSQARFDVNFLFFTAYQYEHASFEIWQNNCLVKIESVTNDNGEEYQVSGTRTDNEFRLVKTSNNSQFPDCVKTFSYWNPDFLNATQLLNPQTGEYTPVNIERLSDDDVTLQGKHIKARKYRLSGQHLEIYLWYSDTDQWLALESVVDASKRLRYQIPGWNV